MKKPKMNANKTVF